MSLYARKLVLRNCGRFTSIQSDFGADYRTQTYVSSEALYASLTRGRTWRAPPIVLKRDRYDFAADYDLESYPIWFTPGIFAQHGSYRLPRQAFDTAYFNVVHEAYPTTSKGYTFEHKTGELKKGKRGKHVPTYGTWQGILPDHHLVTWVFGSDEQLLNTFEVGQTFLLGKKRTMMQLIKVGDVAPLREEKGAFMTPFLQMDTRQIGFFQSFEVLATTMRHLIMRGNTKQDGDCWVSEGESIKLALPKFIIPAHLI